jgi:uncharacterized membrane protein
MKKSLNAHIGMMVATAVIGAMAAASVQAADDSKFETCFGVAKAGKNDCKSSTHICAGKGTADRDPHTFIDLPQGTCAKIVGGALSEPVSKK